MTGKSVWSGLEFNNTVFIYDPAVVRFLARSTQESRRPEGKAGGDTLVIMPATLDDIRQFKGAPSLIKALVARPEQTTMTDWWAAALTRAERVTVRFELPRDKLVITMAGDPSRYGPAIVEVKTQDGRLIKRFERRQLKVMRVRK